MAHTRFIPPHWTLSAQQHPQHLVMAVRIVLAQEEARATLRSFAVLEALMRRPGAVLSRAQLEESVYGWGDEVGSNAIEVHLHNLRKKLGSHRIVNVRGVGYRVNG